ncbi:MAG: hypothetical protein ACYCU8_01225 [Ferrimicrobium acidiphilum]
MTTSTGKINRRAVASSATEWIALIMTTGETVDIDELSATHKLNMANGQKADCIADFGEWIAVMQDCDLRYPQEWSWVLDQINLDQGLRAKLTPSSEPLVHQASHALRKHSYRLQAIRLFGDGIN